MKNNEIKNLFGAVEDISLAPMAEAPASAEAETMPVSSVRKTERDPENGMEAFVSHRERRNGTERVVLRPRPVNRFDDESGAWRPLFGESTETEGGFEMALGGYAAKITKEDCALSFEKDAKTLHDLIRGLSPIPLSFTHTSDGKILKITSARIAARDGVLGKAGEVISLDNGITVACGVGAITVTGVLPEGKSRMSATDFIRGRKVNVGDILK